VDISLGEKRPGHEADHSSPSNAEVKNDGAIPPFNHVSSWLSAQLFTHGRTTLLLLYTRIKYSDFSERKVGV
jgi:hypothetical protein